MKKKIIAVITIICILIGGFLVGTGFQKRTDVVLFDYAVSEDGTAITMNVGVPTSVGYIRGFKDNGGGVKPHYLTFYSTFGGINSSLGAKSTYVLEISPDDTEIYFNCTGGGYEIVLEKDEETGQWIKPTQIGNSQNITFQAIILDIYDSYYLVEPIEGSQKLKSSDQIIVPMKNLDPSLEPEAGDIIEITYDGSIAESYPAQITEVYSIKVIQEANEESEKWAMIPMVMVNGELYLTTGYEATNDRECGIMDGEITSTVDGTEKPTKDNESNFGAGYGYQYGSQEGTIEIYMNDKWWIYATEEVRQQIQFPYGY